MLCDRNAGGVCPYCGALPNAHGSTFISRAPVTTWRWRLVVALALVAWTALGLSAALYGLAPSLLWVVVVVSGATGVVALEAPAVGRVSHSRGRLPFRAGEPS